MLRFRTFTSLPLARLIMATSGGYAVVSLITMMLAAALPLAASEATVTSALIGLIIYPVSIICGFMVKQLHHLLTGLAIIMVSLGSVIAIWLRP